MAAHTILRDNAQVGDATNNIFWLDPWSKDGQKIAAQVRPWTHDLRIHAEAALTLIAQARAAAGANPCRHPVRFKPNAPASALYDAAKVRRSHSAACANPTPSTPWNSAPAASTSSASSSSSPTRWPQAMHAPWPPPTSTDRKVRSTVSRELCDINGVNGRIQDIRNGYTLIRDLYESAWLRSNRPYWLRNMLEQYDYTSGHLARPRRQGPQRPAAMGRRQNPSLSRRHGHPAATAALERSPRSTRAMIPEVFTAQRLITSSGIVQWPRISVNAHGIIESIEACDAGHRDGTTWLPRSSTSTSTGPPARRDAGLRRVP